jgi:flagellar basal-body rod modification protein FlgD
MPFPVGEIGAGVGGPGGLGKEDFLTLLVTQLRYQDPLDPLDAQDFASQLAQFTAMEQQLLTNDLLETQIAMNEVALIAEQNSVAIGMIGSTIVAEGNSVQITGGGDAAWIATSQAASVRIDIVDEFGEVVGSLNATVPDAGVHRIDLSGVGSGLAPGQYSMRLHALNDTQGSVLTPLLSGVVQGVRWGETGPVVVVGGKEISLAGILEITSQESNAS